MFVGLHSEIENLPAWALMWALGVVVFFAVKLATAMAAGRSSTGQWSAARLTLYATQTPTLDPAPFQRPRGRAISDADWWTGLVGVAAAAVVWVVIVPAARLWSDWAGGMAVMAGVVCGLHFGVFRLMTATWCAAGRDVRPIMDRPWVSTSLAEFWGRRWNVAFRDAAHRLLVCPLRRRLSPRWQALAVFLVSGLIHDVVMSTPAGGWGGPTLYFLLQPLGMAAQRSALGRRLGLDRGSAGTIFTAAWLLLPLPLLFHRPFCANVMLPFFDWCAAWAGWEGRLPRRSLVRAGGWMQWSILIASACVPASLNWRGELAKLSPLLRQMFWVYGGYVAGSIVALGAASVFWSAEIAATPLGHGVAAATAAFWGVRLLVGLFWFDAGPFLRNRWLEAGYALLTLGFVTLTCVYGFIAAT